MQPAIRGYPYIDSEPPTSFMPSPSFGLFSFKHTNKPEARKPFEDRKRYDPEAPSLHTKRKFQSKEYDARAMQDLQREWEREDSPLKLKPIAAILIGSAILTGLLWFFLNFRTIMEHLTLPPEFRS